MTTTPPEAPGDAGGSAEPPHEPAPSGPRVTREEAKDLGRIRRSAPDRKIAGVAGGVARHLDIDPLLVRVAFVLFAIFGGGGLLAYAVGWLLIPEEGSDEGVIRVDHRTRTVLLAVTGAVVALSLVGDSLGGWTFPWPLAIIALVIAAVASASRPKPHPGPLTAEGWIPAGRTGAMPGARTAQGASYERYQPGPPRRTADPRRRGPILFWFTMGLGLVGIVFVATLDLAGWDAPISAYPAAVLAACGLMLLVGSVYGRAGGLIFVGLLAALVTLATTAVQDASVGQINSTPTTAATVDDRYELGVGEIILDLTELSAAELQQLDDRTIQADVRIGHVLVVVPEQGLDVTVDSQIDGGGESVIFGERTDGSAGGSHGDEVTSPDLHLDLEVLFGQIEVQAKEAA